MLVEIFKTDIGQVRVAAHIVQQLSQHFPDYRINFDLEDCDRILRIESRHTSIDSKQIIRLMAGLGYACTHLLK